MSKKVLISGYIGFSNFGDDAIFGCLIDYLKSKGAIISALSSTPNYTCDNYKIKAFKYKNPVDILKAIFSSDILISGGGSLLQDKTSKLSLLYYLFIIFLSKLTGKKIIIFSQGIGPIRSPLMQKITRYVLKQSDFITVRDKNSKNILDSWGINSELLCDPFWSINVRTTDKNGTVGVQLREYKNMREDFLENLASVCVKYFRQKKIKVFSFQNSYDRNVCEKFVKLLKKEYNGIDVEFVLNTSVDKTISDFSDLEYIIAMRYHACLLALKCGIKTLPIVYDSKVEILAKDFNLPYINCEIDENISESFEKLINNEQKVEPKHFDWSVFDKFLE